MSERAPVTYVVNKTGLSKRTVQAMAARGQIPGAAKLGSIWTFDKAKLARWIRNKEEQCQRTSIRETASIMPAFKWQGANTAGPLKRLLAAKQSVA